jgi:GAF domain-containing protein
LRAEIAGTKVALLDHPRMNKLRGKTARASADLALLANLRPLVRAQVSPERLVRSVARLLAVEIGQYAVADLVDREGILRRVHIEHADPREAPRLRAICDATILLPTGRIPRLLARGGSELVSNVSDTVRARSLSDLAIAHDPVRSYVASTVVVDAEPIGVITLVSARRARRYTQDDATLLEAVADWVGLGLENALRREAQPRASVLPPPERKVSHSR